MHDNTWRAYGGPGRKNGSCDGGVRSYQVPRKRQGTHVGGWGGMANCCGCSEVWGHACAQPKTPCPSSHGLHPPGGGTAAAVEMVGVGGTWEGGARKGKISNTHHKTGHVRAAEHDENRGGRAITSGSECGPHASYRDAYGTYIFLRGAKGSTSN